jgi:hypothetical protein
MRVEELACCEATLLREIADPRLRRLDIAQTYGLALRSSERTRVDWAKVNAAIMARWSRSALEYIKRLAWRWGGGGRARRSGGKGE